MKLSLFTGSPNCRKVQAVIGHLGLDVELDYLDFAGGDLRKPQFVALNPNAMVPVLHDGDFVLWESEAILRYLGDKAPANTLFPRDQKVRADIMRWQCWSMAQYNMAFGTLAFEAYAKPRVLKIEPDAALVGWLQRGLARWAPVLDGHMKGRRYAVGDQITLADYSLAYLEAYQERVPFDWKPYPHLNAYYERMRAAPHWLASAPKKAPAAQAA
jgi:glutathione S-transferase